MTGRKMFQARMLKRVVVATALATAIGACVVATAGAMSPDKVAFDHTWSSSDPDEGVQHCDGFDIFYNGHDEWRGTVHYDASGNPTSVIWNRKGWEVDTNMTTGKSVTLHRSGAVIVDIVAETVKKTGASWMGTLPGEGVVFHESGFLLHDFYDNVIRMAGPHENPDVAFCEALA